MSEEARFELRHGTQDLEVFNDVPQFIVVVGEGIFIEVNVCAAATKSETTDFAGIGAG